MKSLPCVQLLLEKGAAVNSKSSKSGNTALLVAAKNGATDCLMALLDKAADLYIKDNNGETALDVFMKGKPSYEAMKFFVEADVPIKNGNFIYERKFFSWTFFLDPVNKIPQVDVIRMVREILQNNIFYAKLLCHVEDTKGRDIFGIVDPEVRLVMEEFIYFCERYDLSDGPPVHRSATAVVVYADDHNRKKSLSSSKVEQKVTIDKVVIKFMLNLEQYMREVSVRRNNSFDDNYVVGLKESPDLQVFEKAVQNLIIQERKMKLYKYGIIMEAAERSLDTIFRSERPDLGHIKVLMREIGEAVRHCNHKNIMHGDLKMLNILRVNSRMKLIDLDASAIIGHEFCGSKFSSGVLPPEMFYRLKTDQEERDYITYWNISDESVGSSDGELWAKIQPMKKGKYSKYVVKTFRTESVEIQLPNVEREGENEEEGEVLEPKYMTIDSPIHTNELTGATLPYCNELVRAAPSIDVWSFGLLLFYLCSGQPLLPVNRDDDLADGAAVAQAATWTALELHLRIDKIKIDDIEGPLVKDLLKNILNDNHNRYKDMDIVLNDPFFKGVLNEEQRNILKQKDKDRFQADVVDAIHGLKTSVNEQFESTRRHLDERFDEQKEFLVRIDDCTQRIENLSEEMIQQIKNTEGVLLRGMIESADIVVPSCFIILNQKLEGPVEISDDMDVIPAVTAQPSMKSSIETAHDVKINQSTGWINYLSGIGKTCTHLVASAASKTANVINKVYDIAQELSDIVTDPISLFPNDKFYLYLVDEYNMTPIVTDDGPYPIEITRHKCKETIQKFMPLMKIGLKAIALYNGAGMRTSLSQVLCLFLTFFIFNPLIFLIYYLSI